MGASPGPSPFDDPKHKMVMGYPPMDRYQHPQQLYAPMPPSQKGYPSCSSFDQHRLAYQASSFPNPTKDPYRQPYNNNDYYYQQQPYKHLMKEHDDSVRFARVMLILMIVLVASMGMMSFVMWVLFGTYIPEFEVVSFRVSNFSATSTNYTGSWNADVLIKNTNQELAIDSNMIRSSIFYKEATLGMSSVQGVRVEKRQQSSLNVSVSADHIEHPDRLDSWVLPALAQDRTNGVVIFSLRLALKVNFFAADTVYRKETLWVSCDNLQVMFGATGEEGSLAPGIKNLCLIRLRENLD